MTILHVHNSNITTIYKFTLIFKNKIDKSLDRSFSKKRREDSNKIEMKDVAADMAGTQRAARETPQLGGADLACS